MGIVLSFLCTIALILPAAAMAEENAPPELWTVCPPGPAAGQCSSPRGIAVDPDNGHLYVADGANNRMLEMTAWGVFVKAWGWGVRDGSSEAQTCTSESGCQTGAEGSAPGQLRGPSGVAIDSGGDVYVFERQNSRVQKFSPDGEFLLMFGGGVNQGPNHPGNVCTAQHLSEGDTCGAGTPGAGNGQFSSKVPVGSFVAVGPADQVYVGDENRIQEFDTGGQYQSQIALPGEEVVGALAVDPLSGNVYAAAAGSSQNGVKWPLRRLDETSGEVLETLAVDRTEALAVDRDGNLFVADGPFTTASGATPHPENHGRRILTFDPGGKRIALFADKLIRDPSGLNPRSEFQSIGGLATGSACFGSGSGIYVPNTQFQGFGSGAGAFVRAYGPPPDQAALCPPPPAAPSINAQFASMVGSEFAVLKAFINPHFWSGSAGETRYYLQYATAECVEADGWEACGQERPAAPGAILQGGVVDIDLTTQGIQIDSLEPATAYRYRFVAEGDGAPGVLIAGRGGKAGEAGADNGFRTAPLPGTELGGCANEHLRTGASAALPDCRAYELVSPLDKNGGDVKAPRNLGGWSARLDRAAEDGQAITYSSYRPFAGAISAPFVSQYLTRRDGAAGWQTESISPPQEGEAFVSPLIGLDVPFEAFGSDLRYAWLLTNIEPVLGPGGLPGHINLYRRDNANGTYRGCTTSPPRAPEFVHPPQLQGVSADSQLAIFRTRNELTDDAAPNGDAVYQLYACSMDQGGVAQVHLVSVLPDGTASPIGNTGGGPTYAAYEYEMGHGAALEGAVSADGSRILWTANTGNAADLPGDLYQRINPTATESAREHGSARGTGDLVGPATAIGNLTKFSGTIQKVGVKSGGFAVGQEVSGAGIPEGATVTAVEPEAQRIKITPAATETLNESEFQGAASEVVSGATAEHGAFEVGQTIAATGIPAGTTIVTIQETAPGVYALTLSNKAIQSAAGATLSATSPCTEPEKACTVEISRGKSVFVAANPEGTKILFLNGGLYLRNLETDIETTIAASAEVVGTSRNLARTYFTSDEALAGAAVAKRPNLYLYENGTVQFIGPLSKDDVDAKDIAPSPVSRTPARRTSRVSPDGQTVAFMSNSTELAQLTADYDNIDQASGKPAYEVYRYSALSDELACLSCDPTGARPSVREPSGSSLGVPDVLWTAATLPTWTDPLTSPRALSADGNRVYFESTQALEQTDTNGMLDVYQWETPGSGDCSVQRSSFVAASGGCLELISSGKSPGDSEFVDASVNGRDVFIRTSASLVGHDPGQIDIYDARAGGGFAPPPTPPAGCEGEACQNAPVAPDDPTPASSTFLGAGNVKAGKSPRCRKGKVRRKGRCVARKHKKRHAKHKRNKRGSHKGRGAR